MANSGSIELRVGAFVAAALLVGGVLVFVIGGDSMIFASRTRFEGHFERVDGLRPGSPVRVAGIDVGTVDSVGFAEDGRISVIFSVREDSARYVREGSTVRIGSKGLLGDQLIEVSVGDGEPLPEGSVIPLNQDSMLANFLGETGRQAEGIVRNVDRVTAGFADEQFQSDLAAIAHNLAEITRMIGENDGTLRRLMTDPELANDLHATVQSFRDTGGELAMAARGVRGIVREVQHGDGTAHSLIYGDEGVQLLGNLAGAAAELATILRDIRTGDNNANRLLYGDDAGDLITNLTEMSADLRAIAADVRAGRGTLGGLLVDPSIYEDIKRLVGNLQRNEILRSLVRYSIREDTPREGVPAPEPSE